MCVGFLHTLSERDHSVETASVRRAVMFASLIAVSALLEILLEKGVLEVLVEVRVVAPHSGNVIGTLAQTVFAPKHALIKCIVPPHTTNHPLKKKYVSAHFRALIVMVTVMVLEKDVLDLMQMMMILEQPHRISLIAQKYIQRAVLRKLKYLGY